MNRPKFEVGDQVSHSTFPEDGIGTILEVITDGGSTHIAIWWHAIGGSEGWVEWVTVSTSAPIELVARHIGD